MDIIKTKKSRNGMVVSAHPLASEIGLKILREGGNAVDAAVAVQFALAVVYPAAGNIAGGGFLVYRDRQGVCSTLDFRETAPAKAHRNMYLDSAGEVIPYLSLKGHLAAGVPGTVDGMVKAHERLGKKSWDQLLEPSIYLAENGFPLTEREASHLNDVLPEILEINTIEPTHLHKKKWEAGDLIIQKDLAHTLRLIQAHKRNGFYSGINAAKLVEEMNRGKGLITQHDLANYTSRWREPLIEKYRNFRIITAGLPSSGGIVMMQILKMLEPYPLSTLNWNSSKYIHLLAEAEKIAFADRSRYLGDADFQHVPVQHLLNSDYLKTRFKDFHFNKINPGIGPGNLIPASESLETTHFSIVDSDGNAVAVTTTLNDSYGCKVVVAGGGYFLNNEMDDFSIKPGYANLFGLTGGEANAIHPGKRMLSSMTPTIMEKDHELFLVLGSPGGSRIITSLVQTILNVTEFKMTLPEAIQASRFHHQWTPDSLYLETGRIDEDTRNNLESIGYRTKEIKAMGRVDAILIEDNYLIGGADPRGDDSVSGF